jgi:hypothetical protein
VQQNFIQNVLVLHKYVLKQEAETHIILGYKRYKDAQTVLDFEE